MMEKQTCHCCGQSVEFPKVLIDADDQIINYKSKSERLTNIEFDFVAYLLKRPNRLFLTDDIYNELYGLLPYCDWPDVGIINVLVCKIRKKIKGTGLVLKSHWGNGCSILIEPMPTNQNNQFSEIA